MLARRILHRPSLATRASARLVSSTLAKPIFYDMVHSNNAARIRLWMALKRPEGMEDVIETRMITYPDLQTPEFAAINPLKKVPALIRTDGVTVFESQVILNYLEDKFGTETCCRLLPPTPEGRQTMHLMCRIHDLYIASPNCTAPGFSHSQGAMYLSKGWHGEARAMDLPARAAKLLEIWKQLSWLEFEAARHKAAGPHLLGEQLSLADLTWFPTCVFMEFMLPKVFDWPHLFDPRATDPAPTPFPSLARWYDRLQNTPAFSETRDDIWGYWEKMEAAGQFEPIRQEIATNTNPALKFQYGVPQTVSLNYQAPPPPGKSTGRYINQPDRGDVADEHVAADVSMHDARELCPPASLSSHGFELKVWPSQLAADDFRNDGSVVEKYYEEMRELVKASSGAERVFIFDHTLRETGNSNLNAADGGSAAPVPRVHCDYTASGAPRRLQQLAEEGIYSRIRLRVLMPDEAAALAAGRFAFINVWRSIDATHPVMQQPLAVCDEDSVPEADRFTYELRFPERTGENYSLRHSPSHRWHYYSRQTKDECLLFKVYDKHEDGPRFVFHTAFEDPSSPPDAPPRQSIEVRAIAFFDPPPQVPGKAADNDVADAMAKTALTPPDPFEGR